MLINFKFDQFLNWLVSRGVAFFVARGIKFEFETSDVNNIVSYRKKNQGFATINSLPKICGCSMKKGLKWEEKREKELSY